LIFRLKINQLATEFTAGNGQQMSRRSVFHPRSAGKVGEIVDSATRQLTLTQTTKKEIKKTKFVNETPRG
jgi:hypothetical protein